MAGYDELSRRERQIMDALHALGRASVADVRAAMDDPPSYDSVRVTLSIMERKGLVTHERESRRYLYRPREAKRNARARALKQVVRTFFDDDAPKVVSTLLGDPRIDDAQLDALGELIEAERERRRGEAPKKHGRRKR